METHLERMCFGVIHVLIDATAVDLPGGFIRVDQVAMIRDISTAQAYGRTKQDSPILQDLSEKEAILEILERSTVHGVHVGDFRET